MGLCPGMYAFVVVYITLQLPVCFKDSILSVLKLQRCKKASHQNMMPLVHFSIPTVLSEKWVRMYLALYPKINTTFPSQWSTVYLAKLVINRNFFFLKTNCVWHYHITILNCSFIYIKKTFYSYKKASKGKIHKQNTPKLHSCLILSLA